MVWRCTGGAKLSDVEKYAHGQGWLCHRPELGMRAVNGRLRSGVVDEVLQLFAGLEERNLLGGHFDLFAGLGIAPYASTPSARAEAAEAADFDFVALLQRHDDAVEDGLDDGFGFLARKLGNAQNLFDKVSLGQRRLLGHRVHASSQITRTAAPVIALACSPLTARTETGCAGQNGPPGLAPSYHQLTRR